MQDVQPYVKLDTVLSIIANRPFGITYEGIKTILNEMKDNLHRDLYLADLPLILDKLESDKYLVKNQKEVRDFATNAFKYYEIQYKTTFDGKMFHLDEGYTKKYITNVKEEALRRSNDYWMVRGTWAAGIAAFLLFLMEIVKFLYQLYCKTP